MSLKVVAGAGATSVPTALLLAEAGEQVRLVSRRGSGPDHPNIDLVKADATDTARLAEIARGAATLYNCAMPPYDQWPVLWPPLAASLLAAAEQKGADYVMVGNAYGYGPVDGPMTEDLPVAATTSKGRVRADVAGREGRARRRAGARRRGARPRLHRPRRGLVLHPHRPASGPRRGKPRSSPLTWTPRTHGPTRSTPHGRSSPPASTTSRGAAPGTSRAPPTYPFASSPS